MITPCASPHQPGWLALRKALWPQTPDTAHLEEMAAFLAEPERYAQYIAYTRPAEPAPPTEPIGFIEVSLRRDYVNGTESSPVAFVEGIYVAPAHRRRGVARDLLAAATKWAVKQGASEMASDAALDNHASHRMHQALGFEETERVVYYRKSLT